MQRSGRCLEIHHGVRSAFAFLCILGALTYMLHSWWMLSFTGPKVIDKTFESNVSIRPYNGFLRPSLLGNNSIAIGMGITSRGALNFKSKNMAERFEFFYTLLPSFCKTASKQFFYTFYLAYDLDDPVFVFDSFLIEFHQTFNRTMKALCEPNGIHAYLSLLRCRHSHKPAWAQNDAMIEGYLDGAEFFYRINDDTEMVTPDWAEAFITALRGYNPPLVGVVGPTHQGGYLGILTYDFVHRTHVDIFGYYYPRKFIDWSADNWITNVYVPGRSSKLKKVHLKHVMSSGTRYSVHMVTEEAKKAWLKKDRVFVDRYVEYKTRHQANSTDLNKNIISMSLFGDNPNHIWGAIRNAQLTSILFPGWKLRFYALDPGLIESNAKLIVPWRILDALKRLDAEVVYVHPGSGITSPLIWSYYVIFDANVDYFLIRDSGSRLSMRDADAVRFWIENAGNFSAHCIRDHAQDAERKLNLGLWGGKRRAVQDIIGKPLSKFLFTKEKLRVTLPSIKLIPAPTKNQNTFRDLVKGVSFLDLTTDKAISRGIDNQRNRSDVLRLPTTSSVTTEGAHTESRISSGPADLLQDEVTDILWSLLENDIYCHDSVSCHKWPNSHPFPTAKVDKFDTVGLVYDENEELIDADGLSVEDSHCVPRNMSESLLV